jgi:DNA-directed RNA polymerase subunit RPC12/RpoP
MEDKEIVCEHCGEGYLIRDPAIPCAKVRLDGTNDPWQTFFIYRCLVCGERVYVDKGVLVN